MNILERIRDWGLESLGYFYGTYQGFIVDVNDPLELGRVRLHIPLVDQRRETFTDIWAIPSNAYGNKSWGFWEPPKKGDRVNIEFIQGQLLYPIYSPASFGKEKPKEFHKNNIAYRTRSGTLIELYEEADKEYILIKRKDHLAIKITNDNVFLGTSNDSEPLVMGDKNETLLKDTYSLLADIHNRLGEVKTLFDLASTFDPKLIPLKPHIIKLGTQLTQLKTQVKKTEKTIPDIKSKITKTD